MKLIWYGKEIKGKVAQATLTGINATMAECVEHAKQNHNWINRTAVLEGSIKIADYAQPTDSGARGLWGSVDVAYALIHELGGWAGRGLRVRIPARPYLRPAADANYSHLANNIRRAMK